MTPPTRRITSTVVVLAVLATLTVLSGPSTAEGPELTTAPGSGPTGTRIAIEASDCLMPGGEQPGEGLVVRLVNPTDASVPAFDTLPVAADGSVTGALAVPAGTPAATYDVVAACSFPGEGETDLPTYRGGTFTVTGEGSNAEAAPAAPATPPTGPDIEPYPTYDGQSTCSPTPKPGTVQFRDLLLRTYAGTRDFGISRACDVGGTSEHKEGRAFDWGVSAASATGRAQVNDLFAWLFATDQYGHRHAIARRLGLMYIIWNRQIFRLYRPSDGWQAYTGSNPHTDHVHFSFTRAGGAGTTSFWTGPPRESLPASPITPSNTSLRVSGSYTDVVTGDFNGNGRDDVLWYGAGAAHDFIWWGNGDRSFSSSQIFVSGQYRPITGDFDANGRDDIVWYGLGSAADYVWWSSVNGGFVTERLTVNGRYRVTAGNYDGDRGDDIMWYAPGRTQDYVWYGVGARQWAGRGVAVNGDYEHLASGDFDQDGRDDIFWHDAGSGGDYAWYGMAGRTFTSVRHDIVWGSVPIAGDYNGDGDADISWYGAGSDDDQQWLAGGRRFDRYRINVNGVYDPASGDFDGNGRADVIWYGEGAAVDALWWH